MTALKCGASRCGLCRFYSHEGRRGGQCSQLSAPVNSQWKACCLAASPFGEPSQHTLKPIAGITAWSASAHVTSTVDSPVQAPAGVVR